MTATDDAFARLQSLPQTRLDFRANPCITQPKVITLPKTGGKATLFPVNNTTSTSVPESLFEYMHQEFNHAVEEGLTYPHHETMDSDQFRGYWFCSFVAILIKGEWESLKDADKNGTTNWETEFLGTYYVKPNYIGRCSHNCNGGFLVNRKIRGMGLGEALGKTYLDWAPRLGYTYSVFNLVFVTNVASWKIWDKLGFNRIGYIPGVGILKGVDHPVDAIMYGIELKVKE
ncbi:hypothetical protein BABINDRAFT_162683 [Babjeviella inositovora NRRL Y-12698]|uniref:N-acetyltransferase domain-containing protein n=1 Tax=Babjeviella inositovora NRRL Y-12698 TaxID=984486 RepID=A0A1E3QL94_9ASCO|nr:uncharacterized protein BABINDRAFT_162683 [Babjeviella inositovora NRRL Y-12698]ODQ78466.1 hypothetical protein BABINDRAFT_162683 [Babjeviella inositovora NRRL Y-12698]